MSKESDKKIYSILMPPPNLTGEPHVGHVLQHLILDAVARIRAFDDILKSIDDSFAYTKAIEWAALLVALLGLLNTFLISIMERTRELGMLRAVGMTRGQMARMIMQESLMQGGFGAIVAVILGALISSLWVRYSLSHVLGWIIIYSFPWQAIGKTVLTGLAVTLIAGIYPAYRAATIEIKDALEYE